MVGYWAQADEASALVDVVGVVKAVREVLATMTRELGAVDLSSLLLQEDSIGEIGHVAGVSLACRHEPLEQVETVPLEGGVEVGVLRDQPRGSHPFVADQ